MYAFQQDVPINSEIHRGIREALGSTPPSGLIAHLVLEQPGGTLRYIDLWESRAQCDRFTEERLHPVVGRALAEAGIRPDGEPPRIELTVADLWAPGLSAPGLSTPGLGTGAGI